MTLKTETERFENRINLEIKISESDQTSSTENKDSEVNSALDRQYKKEESKFDEARAKFKLFTEFEKRADRSRESVNSLQSANGTIETSAARRPEAVIRETEAALRAVENEKARIDFLGKSLATDLAQFGAALTKEEEVEYTKQFKNRYAADYAKYDRALTNFENVLNKNAGELEKIFEQGKSASQMKDAYRLLTRAADTLLTEGSDKPGVKSVLDVAGRLLNSPAATANLQKIGISADQVRKDLVVKPLLKFQTECFLLSENKAEAVSKFLDYVDATGAAALLGAGASEAKQVWSDYGKYLNDLAAGRPADFEVPGSVKSSPLGKFLTVGSMVAHFGLGASEAGRSDRDVAILMKEFAQGSSDAIETVKLLVDALKPAKELGKLGKFGLEAVEIAARFTPVLSMIVNSASIAMHGDEFKQNPNAGLMVAVLGDTVGIVGSFMQMFPPSAPIGEAVSALGTVLSVGGDLLSEFFTDRESRARRESLLNQMFKDPALASALANGDPERFAELEDKFGFDANDIKDLARRFGRAVTNTHHSYGAYLGEFDKITGVFKMSKGEVKQLLTKLADNPGIDPARSLFIAMNNLSQLRADHGLNDYRDYVYSLKKMINEGNLPADAKQTMQIVLAEFERKAEQLEAERQGNR